jgi:hypothetical protein
MAVYLFVNLAPCLCSTHIAKTLAIIMNMQEKLHQRHFFRHSPYEFVCNAGATQAVCEVKKVTHSFFFFFDNNVNKSS